MTTKQRIKRLENTKGRGVENIAARHVLEVGGRYFETRKHGEPFKFESVIQAMTWTAGDFAAAGFPELTRAEYDELTRRGLNTCVQFDYKKLLPPNRE